MSEKVPSSLGRLRDPHVMCELGKDASVDLFTK